MSAPHFRSDAALAARFDARVARDPAGAVHQALAAGLSVDLADVPTPHLAALGSFARTDVEGKGNFQLARSAELANERRAVQLVTHQANVRRGQGEQRDAARAAERAAFVDRRIAELEAEHRKELMAGFARQAEAEARAMFDEPDEKDEPPPIAAMAARPKAARPKSATSTKEIQ